jgi:hypothetical protein
MLRFSLAIVTALCGGVQAKALTVHGCPGPHRRTRAPSRLRLNRPPLKRCNRIAAMAAFLPVESI